MKFSTILLSAILLYSQSQAQFTIKGVVKQNVEQANLYIHKIKLNGQNDSIDSIRINKGKEFFYLFESASPGELYKLNLSANGTSQDFPENAFIFSTSENEGLQLEIPSLKELYNTKIILGSEENKIIAGTISRRLSSFFELMAEASSKESMDERKKLFDQVLAFQQQLQKAVQSNIIESATPVVLMTNLYFLAKIQQGSGQADFSSYYNSVKALLPATELNHQLNKLTGAESINVKDVLSLNLTQQDGKEVVKLQELIKTEYFIIDFWASWCGACRKVNKNELPTIVKQLKNNKKVSLVSVSVDENADKWKKALVQDKISWNTYLVKRNEQSYIPAFLNGNGLPLYLLVSKNGELLFSSGSFDLIKEKIKQYQ